MKADTKMFIVKWTNKFSGEEGFVKCINNKDGYFENTFDRADARKWRAASVKNILTKLAEYCADNNYEAVEA